MLAQDIQQSEQSRRVLGASARTRTEKKCDSCTTGSHPPPCSTCLPACSIIADATGSSENVNIPKLKGNADGGYEADDVTVCKHDAPNSDKYCMDWTIPDNCTLLTQQAPCPHAVVPLLNAPLCSKSSSSSAVALVIFTSGR